MSQYSLSGALEELVLTSLVWNTELASAITLRVTADLFTTRFFRTIAKAALDHVTRYAEAPKTHLPDILEDELKNSEQGPYLWKQIGRMEEIYTDIQPDFVLNELSTFITTHKMRLAISRASEFLQKGELDKAEEALHKIEISETGSPGIWMNDPESALSFLDKNEDDDNFSSGIEALDTRGIRPERKTLYVVMAPKKRGKSTMLIHIGREAAFINRQKVLHVTLEMSEQQTAKRYIQSVCSFTQSEADNVAIQVPQFKKDGFGFYQGIEFKTIEAIALSKSTRNIAADKLRRLNHGRQNLLIKEFPTGSLTMQQLVMYLDYLKRVKKFEPDLLIVDYANLMHINTAQLRIETGRIFRELRGIAVARNMAVVTATQGNRSSENAKIVGATHVSEDWSVMGTADTVITICRTPEEKEKRLARLYVAAARDRPDQFLVLISQSYETCQFAIDSVYMNKFAIRDFNRMVDGEDADD